MNFSEILKKIFGNKSERDRKLIEPLVEKVKAVHPQIAQLDNDALRERTRQLRKQIKDSASGQEEKIAELKAKIEDTPIDEREEIFNQIDKLEKEVLEIYEGVLNEILPEVFAIVKETAKRFSENEETIVTATDFDRELAADPRKDFITIEGDKAIYHNHWTAGGNDLKWEMVHYDVQLFGGIVLHQGKIAEMATEEGKTLVATLPVFLNALTGNGVHVVTVNDYLAKRDSEWMGPIYEFHGLSVDCIDKHQPNSEARRRAYQADITFGTNNEFGFDYLRDNMATSPADLVQRSHNYAIVDEVDSVLVDDARTPLIISGPVPKGDVQMFEEYQPLVESLVDVQRKLATQYLAEAKQKISEGKTKNDQKLLDEGFLSLYRSHKALPKNKPLIKYLSEEGIKAGMLKTEEIYMENNNRRMPEAIEPLYFVVDEKLNSCDLTDKGTEWLAKKVNDNALFVLPDIASQLSELEVEAGLTDQERVDKKDELLSHYAIQSERVHTLQQLLKAYTMFNKDDEYVVIDGEVKIVDEQTGRIMEGRRWSDGLHQAVEAKEHVKVEAATQTFATITLQNYFRMYHKLSGMTGTASTEAGEFWDIYKLDVVEIPTNRPVLRKDMDDRVYKTARAKYNAVIEEIVKMRESGRPVLVGTTSVEISELISKMLSMRKIPHQVLNAKLHQKEADIVALAGQSVNGLGAVTIATNMAGRGTDIKLSPEVKAAGGLAIIGTERHESRRIDNQLRGRASRQGDPGSSVFFLSLEDDLIRRFGGDRLKNIALTFRLKENTPIQLKILSHQIESAQKKIEIQNFGMRKTVLQFDDVMNAQREIIYAERNKVLDGLEVHSQIMGMFPGVISKICDKCVDDEKPYFEWDFDKINAELELGLLDKGTNFASEESCEGYDREDFEEALLKKVESRYNQRMNEAGKYGIDFEKLEKFVLLRVVDTNWMNHIDDMQIMKNEIFTRGFGNQDPILAYKKDGYEMFDDMIEKIRETVCLVLLNTTIEVRQPETPKFQETRVYNAPTTASKANSLQKPEEIKKQVTDVRTSPKIGRNDPCPCGSGKKYKNCCGK